MKYKDIELDEPVGTVSMTHSVILDAIRKESTTRNMDYTDKLGELPWDIVNKNFPNLYTHASQLFSLMHMNYQVCNGGVGQYYFNGYHNARPPFTEDDIALVNKDAQAEAFTNLVSFAQAVYPDKNDKNEKLEKASHMFSLLEYEENALDYETIYSDEDEYIYDAETDMDIPNPDYFEPYDEPVYVNRILNEKAFEDAYYEAYDYVEELIELQAQYIYKSLNRELERQSTPSMDLKILKEMMHNNEDPSLTARITQIQTGISSPIPQKQSTDHTLDQK